jgi:predicted transcriptional regulator
LLSIAHRIIGPLELAILECFWQSGRTQTSGEILAALRQTRSIAATTVTSTLARLCEQGFLTRELAAGSKMPWRYTAHYASRSALLAATMESLAVQMGANHRDRAEALGALLGVVRST